MAVSRHLVRPVRKGKIFDLACDAGLDMSQWIATASSYGRRKENPRFAYELAFNADDRFALLNIWYSDISPFGKTLVCRGNWRAFANRWLEECSTLKKASRAMRADQAVRRAAQLGLPIRLIINDGNDGVVERRELDPASWRVLSYDDQTGSYAFIREELAVIYADQFAVTRRERTPRLASPVSRSGTVRTSVLQRARGLCEFCGTLGFRMRNGAIYLETHHIVPLAEGGEDDAGNVIALCANDHREAHFGYARQAMRAEFLARMARRRDPKARLSDPLPRRFRDSNHEQNHHNSFRR